jgi:hypothetical protein
MKRIAKRIAMKHTAMKHTAMKHNRAAGRSVIAAA